VTNVTALLATYRFGYPCTVATGGANTGDWAEPVAFCTEITDWRVTMRVQLLATVAALAITTTAASAYKGHHHRHHAHLPKVAHVS